MPDGNYALKRVVTKYLNRTLGKPKVLSIFDSGIEYGECSAKDKCHETGREGEGADFSSDKSDQDGHDVEEHRHAEMEIIEGLRSFVSRRFDGLEPDVFAKEIKQICATFGFPVTIRR